MPLLIGVDVDGTLVECIGPMADCLKRHGIVVPGYKETYDYDLSKVWKCSAKEAVRRVNLFYASDEFQKMTPIEGVREAFLKLFPPHTAYPITARPQRVENVTRDFFHAYFDGRYEELYHLHHYDGTGKISKGEIAKKLRLDIFVEDALHQAEEIASHGIPVLLLTHPWNKNRPEPKGVKRINGGWDEVASYVESYKRD